MARIIWVAHPVIDHGGTFCRAGWVLRKMVNGRFSGMPKVISYHRFETPLDKKTGQPDLAKCLALEKKIIMEHRPRGVRIWKVVGGAFPGAWLKNGLVYPNTVNTNRQLEGVHLSRRFSRMMGKGWKTVINNDGVAHALAISQGLVSSITRFPHIREALLRTGKIAGLMPATGFSGGAFIYKDGRLTPVAGPQQFFDIIIDPGEGVIDPDGLFLTPEDYAAGVGLSFQARRSFLRKRYSEEELSTQNIGPLLYRLAFSKSKRIKTDEREFALSLYRGAARGIAKTMRLTYEGGLKAERRKLVVNHPRSLETSFWKGIKGIEVFVLGGWLTNPQLKRFFAKALRKELEMACLSRLQFIFADDTPAGKKMVKGNSTGLIGAALLV